MSFKVKDLMVGVGPLQDDEYSTCPLLSRTTGGACIESVFDNAQRVKHGLALLKAQLRHAVARV